MRYLTIIFIFVITLISVLGIIGLEYFTGDNMFLAVLVEGIIVFFAVLFLLKITKENHLGVVFLFAFFFILLETGVYAICESLGFVDYGMKELISFRMLYSSIFTFIWIPLTCLGLKYKDKFLWVLFWIVGFCIHLVGNLIFQVIS